MEFERLSNRVKWTEIALLGKFISGLKETLCDEVQISKTSHLNHIIALAISHEEKLGRRKGVGMPSKQHQTTSQLRQGGGRL